MDYLSLSVYEQKTLYCIRYFFIFFPNLKSEFNQNDEKKILKVRWGLVNGDG